jgi:hypothetical protein
MHMSKITNKGYVCVCCFFAASGGISGIGAVKLRNRVHEAINMLSVANDKKVSCKERPWSRAVYTA